MLNDFPCLCSLPTEPSPEGLQLGDFTFVQRGIDTLNLTKIHLFMVVTFHIGACSFVWGAKPTKALLGDGTVTNRRPFRKLYYQTMSGGTQAFGCSAVITTSYVRR